MKKAAGQTLKQVLAKLTTNRFKGALTGAFVTGVLNSSTVSDDDIEAPVMKELRALQKREGGTLGSLVSQLLAEALARRPRQPSARVFEWATRPMRARVDLADKEAVYAILDRSDRAAEP